MYDKCRCLSLLQLPTMLGSESLPARNDPTSYFARLVALKYSCEYKAAITTLGRQGFVVKAGLMFSQHDLLHALPVSRLSWF